MRTNNFRVGVWLICLILVFSFFFLVLPVQAAENPLGNFPGEDLEAGDITKIVVGLSCWLTRVAFTLTTIFVIIAGFRFMVAQGNSAKYTEAVKNFQMVLWGILVIYGVYVIIATVAHAVGIENFSFIPLVC
ncbi:MAG: hypothetical protein Q8R34_02310 [bacterium]|nr:hypothetical protein [bacterium]